MTAPWCENSGGAPSNVKTGEPPTGVCWRCRRRVKLLTSGRLRRHRTEPGIVMVDGQAHKPASDA